MQALPLEVAPELSEYPGKQPSKVATFTLPLYTHTHSQLCHWLVGIRLWMPPWLSNSVVVGFNKKGNGLKIKVRVYYNFMGQFWTVYILMMCSVNILCVKLLVHNHDLQMLLRESISMEFQWPPLSHYPLSFLKVFEYTASHLYICATPQVFVKWNGLVETRWLRERASLTTWMELTHPRALRLDAWLLTFIMCYLHIVTVLNVREVWLA